MALLAGGHTDACCTGFKHEGEPKGTIEDIGGLQTYISKPPKESNKVIFYYADVFGPFYINAKLIQDYLASFGFWVVGPDYFKGDTIEKHDGEKDFDRPAWFGKVVPIAQEATPKWIEAAKARFGPDAKYTAVGICFGGPFAVEAAQQDYISAAAFAHPANISEESFGKIKKPFNFNCAETDALFPADKRNKAEEIIKGLGVPYHFNIYSGVSHGYSTRGDLKDGNVIWAREQTFLSIVNWFNRFTA